MGNIVLLDELTINKIAAGEVIERPASVIKEMVENSIDAGATNITVEIKNGGISYIKVSDNGKGIAQDDLEIAFERHATSKIRSADDLNTVTSMGFRGEALASIAAIANVELVSKTEEQETGYKIVVEGGNVLKKEETGCRTGTTITVQNLFYNTPVRYKFLKKDYTESGYIEDVITRIALVNPKIAIKLINTGKTIIQTNGNGDLKAVVYSIYGKDIANAVIPVSYRYEDIKVSGIIGKPEIARSNRSNQLFFVNKRFIKDRTLTAATEQAYKGLIPIGKFGFVILNLKMNPSKVDVNVHPAKLEVRFQEENKVFQAIYHAIKETLLKGELVANTEKSVKDDTVKIDRNTASFEERLKNLRGKKEETGNTSGGLFGFRKNAGKQIAKYTDEESKIKTNIISDIYNKKAVDGVAEEQAEYSYDAPQKTEKTTEASAEGMNASEEMIAELIKRMKMKKDAATSEKMVSEHEDAKETVEAFSAITNKMNEKQDKEAEQSEKNTEQTYEESKSLDEKLEQLGEVSKPSDGKLGKSGEGSESLDEKSEQLDEESKAIDKTTNRKTVTEILKELEEAEKKAKKGEAGEEIEIPKALLESGELENKSFDEMYEQLFGKAPQTKLDQEAAEEEKVSAIDIVKNNISVFDTQEELKKPTYKFIGIVFNTYIILEIDNEMYILDQHAAHERIMYEKVKENYYRGGEKDSQMLLLPDVITLTHKEMDIAKENMDLFKQAGFTLEEFGENTIKLTGVPNICLDLNTKELFLETLDEINTVARTAKQEKEEKFIATVACKAAVKANMALTEQEVESLMNKLLELPNPFTCPHGRPTAIKMTKYDIERKFARK